MSVFLFSQTAHAAWHWELVNGEFQSDITYDKFVEFNAELYKVSVEAGNKHVLKTTDGIIWITVTAAPDYSDGEIQDLYGDQLNQYLNKINSLIGW